MTKVFLNCVNLINIALLTFWLLTAVNCLKWLNKSSLSFYWDVIFSNNWGWGHNIIYWIFSCFFNSLVTPPFFMTYILTFFLKSNYLELVKTHITFLKKLLFTKRQWLLIKLLWFHLKLPGCESYETEKGAPVKGEGANRFLWGWSLAPLTAPVMGSMGEFRSLTRSLEWWVTAG